jgi:hypothetical protein
VHSDRSSDRSNHPGSSRPVPGSSSQSGSSRSGSNRRTHRCSTRRRNHRRSKRRHSNRRERSTTYHNSHPGNSSWVHCSSRRAAARTDRRSRWKRWRRSRGRQQSLSTSWYGLLAIPGKLRPRTTPSGGACVLQPRHIEHWSICRKDRRDRSTSWIRCGRFPPHFPPGGRRCGL